MGACLSAPKPETDGPSVSARSARTFGVAPVQTAKSDVESSGEMVEVPLDTPPAAASRASSADLGSTVTFACRKEPKPLPLPAPDAAVASALEGSDDKAAEPGFSADRVASAEAKAAASAEGEAAAAREQDVSLVLSDDPSEEATFSDSGEGDEEEDDDSDEYETDASSAEEDEGEDAHRSGSTDDATGETIEDVTEDVNEDVTEEATEEVTDDAPAIAPATAPAANAPAAIAPPPAADASDDAPTPVPGTPEQTRADAYDFEDSLSVVDMGPVSDSEASGSEFDSAASDGDGDGDEDAPGTEPPRTATSAGISASTDGSADATVSDTLDEDALGDRENRETDLGSAGATVSPRPAVPEETESGRRRGENDAESSRDDSESESSYDSESSSAYGDEGDRFDADAGPRVASTVEAFGSTVDATVTEVRARSKHSPPPTPRVRGAADPESLGATPRLSLIHI